MDTTIERGAKVLHDGEEALRRLLAEAATSGDYESVLWLAYWAKYLAEVSKRPSDRSLPPTIDQQSKQKTSEGGEANGLSGPPAHHKPKAAKRSRGKRSGYPKFFRRAEELVKVGWSKHDKREYQHKAPHRVVVHTAKAVEGLGSRLNIFTTDQILPLSEQGEGTEIPDYQAYLALAWLRHLGLLEKHGRQGYSVAKVPDFVGVVEKAWATLNQE